jgi:hypothetical protein
MPKPFMSQTKQSVPGYIKQLEGTVLGADEVLIPPNRREL